jgi:hypothetical protein
MIPPIYVLRLLFMVLMNSCSVDVSPLSKFPNKRTGSQAHADSHHGQLN